MIEDEDFEAVETESGAIGVGMGGSCPVCRAPVDLGQEFCLECGSPIRFTPRQRRPQRGRPAAAGGEGAARGASRMPSKSGFPWVPFLIVLALLGGGGAFALVDGGGGDKSSKKESTEDALPTITNSTPETDTNASSSTTTVEDCSSVSPIDDTVPATTDPTTGQPIDGSSPTGGSTGDEIPEFGSDGSGGIGDASGVPSTEPGSSETVTVDRNGDLCPSTSGTSTDSTFTDPASTTPTTSTTPVTSGGTTSTPTTSTSSTAAVHGDWPADKEGWTVIVAGYANDEQRARQGAADVREDGFSDVGVLLSDDFTSLCPGFWVVFSGEFTKRSDAERRLDQMSAKDYAGMRVREIKRTGAHADDCTTARPQN